jgi:hypothetical protein
MRGNLTCRICMSHHSCPDKSRPSWNKGSTSYRDRYSIPVFVSPVQIDVAKASATVRQIEIV